MSAAVQALPVRVASRSDFGAAFLANTTRAAPALSSARLLAAPSATFSVCQSPLVVDA